MTVAAAPVGEDLLRALLQGTPPGTVYALIALGFVLAYKTSGVFNLAFGAQAYVSAAMYFQARTEWGWGRAAGAGRVGVPASSPRCWASCSSGSIFRHLRTASSVAKLVVAIGLTVAIPAIFEVLVGFEPVAGRTPEGIVPGGATVFYDPFGVYRFSRDEVVAMGVALVATVLGLAALFRCTAIGLQMRAVVESPRMTELNGIRSDRVSAFSLGAVQPVRRAGRRADRPPVQHAGGPRLLQPRGGGHRRRRRRPAGQPAPRPARRAGARRPHRPGQHVPAPLVGRPPAAGDDPGERHAGDAVRRALRPAGAVAGRPPHAREQSDPLSGVDPPPPALAALDRSAGLTRATRVFAVAFFVSPSGWWCSPRPTTSWLFLVTQAVILATIYLSITVITGFAGQISLCQGTFAAIGAFTAFQLADRCGMPVLLAGLIGALIAALGRRRAVAARAAARAACGWRSPRWPSRSSSTR